MDFLVFFFFPSNFPAPLQFCVGNPVIKIRTKTSILDSEAKAQDLCCRMAVSSITDITLTHKFNTSDAEK